jgi:3-dehydroquinate synthase
MASTAAPTGDLLRTRDAIAMPGGGRPAVEARAARSDVYRIHVTRAEAETVERVAGLIGDSDVAIVTDDVVMDLHGTMFVAGLEERLGRVPEVAVMPAGEGSKSLDQATRLWHWLAAGRLGRRDVLVTFGGGVVNDLGGWVASGYMRGMRYVNVPTTLVGQVDAGIGGKLAVNHRSAKNLIGGFHQPAGVVSNIAYLRTLDGRHVRAGIAETVKKALIASPEYWAFIESHADALLAGDEDALERLVVAAGAIKAELIARDPYEHDSRRTLGFGHALAHPLETVTGYGPILHGEAVAFGMAVEARMALARGLLPRSTFARIITLLRRLSLPTTTAELPVPVDGRELLAATEKVRLARGGSLRWVLPLGLGDTVIADDVAGEELAAALRRSGVTVPG